MSLHTQKTADYKIITDSGRRRYRFFCEVSGAMVCEVDSICMEDSKEELRIVWETVGKKHFNRCLRCGKWVSDVMYNADVLECVECTPWEEMPNYCSKCGAKIITKSSFCPQCGVRLRYEGSDRHG